VGRGKVEIQNQDSHFSTAPTACGARKKKNHLHKTHDAPMANPAEHPLPGNHRNESPTGYSWRVALQQSRFRFSCQDRSETKGSRRPQNAAKKRTVPSSCVSKLDTSHSLFRKGGEKVSVPLLSG
jgi:hypothetical protein